MQPFTLRNHRPGDLGTIIARHGIFYAHHSGYDMRFEALVARICADFIDNFDPKRECCWIAENGDGKFLGCVMLVKAAEDTARLRLLYVEPDARGMGLGGKLIDECLKFAEMAGFQKIQLWTQSGLLAARRLYEKAGFTLLRTEVHKHFGPEDVGEFWEISFGDAKYKH